MDKNFKNLMNSAASATSDFVKKMYLFNNEGKDTDIPNVKIETTITILDENNVPIMVTRETKSAFEEKINTEVQPPVFVQPVQIPAVPQTPVVQETQPPVIPQAPVVQDVQPPVIPQAPVVQEAQPPVIPQAPVVQETQPPVIPQAPVVQEVQPPVIPQAPVVQEVQPPVAKEEKPQTETTEADKKKKIEFLLKKYSNKP